MKNFDFFRNNRINSHIDIGMKIDGTVCLVKQKAPLCACCRNHGLGDAAVGLLAPFSGDLAPLPSAEEAAMLPPCF